jgi:hypothetical protein
VSGAWGRPIRQRKYSLRLPDGTRTFNRRSGRAEPNKRPGGGTHQFDVACKDHPRRVYIGLQDHGADCRFKNINRKPLR